MILASTRDACCAGNKGKLNENTPRPVSDYFDSFKRESEPTILLKSIFAGVAALFTAALATYGLSAAPCAIARRFRKGQSSVYTPPYACEVPA
jgi:hypothetical protein